ncbi:MAG: response regulator [Verrucomicrobiota bacterium]|nr:response regulator [Verrucomicrobiota bacterium]
MSSDNQAASVNGVRVFLVDDETEVTEMLKELIPLLGFEVAGEAKDGLEAIEQFFLVLPDVTIMDCKMPIMDGMKAAAAIHSQHPQAKILMLSGHFIDTDAAHNAGIFKVLNKPVRAEDLKKSIEEAVAESVST